MKVVWLNQVSILLGGRFVWVGNTPIIQSGCHGYFIGRLDLTFSGHKMVDVRHELVCVDESIKPDAEMARRVQEVVVPHRNYLEEVVG